MNLVQRHDADGDVFINPAHVASRVDRVRNGLTFAMGLLLCCDLHWVRSRPCPPWCRCGGWFRQPDHFRLRGIAAPEPRRIHGRHGQQRADGDRGFPTLWGVVVRGLLRGPAGTAESASGSVFPDAVHRLFRGSDAPICQECEGEHYGEVCSRGTEGPRFARIAFTTHGQPRPSTRCAGPPLRSGPSGDCRG